VALAWPLLLIPALLLLAGGRRGVRRAPEVGPWGDAYDPPEAIAVGKRGDPEIESLLTEMDDEFRSRGVNLSWIDAAEVTVMRKTAGYHAIPPREYWPRMIATILWVFMPIRRALGSPIVITSGYREPGYNAAVEGSEDSRHMYFEALDMVAEDTNRQAMVSAGIYVRDGENLRMGLGIYGTDRAATRIHVDTGHDQRTWKNARYWIEKAMEAA
jgi:hypothetical protein